MKIQLSIYLGLFFFVLLPLYVILRVILLKHCHKIKTTFIHETTSFCLFISILMILYLTILPTFMMIDHQIYLSFQQEHQSMNYIPFKTIQHLIYLIHQKIYLKYAYSNLLGNIFLFLPFGFFLSFFLKKKVLLKVIALSFLFSTGIEIIQLFQKRIADVDDIILNVNGALLGCFLFLLIHRLNHIVSHKNYDCIQS